MVSIPSNLPELHINPVPVSRHSGSLSPGSLSPCSTGSWDISFKQLSDSLSQICHSPTSSPGLHGYMKNGEHHKSSESTISNRPQVVSSHSMDSPHHTDQTSPPANGKLSPSFFMKKNGRFCRKVRVRHEETKQRLHEQLSFICRRGCKDSSTGSHDRLNSNYNKKTDLMAMRPVLRRESIKMTYRNKVDLEDNVPENVFVKLNDASCEVIAFKNGNENRLDNSDIPDDSIIDAEKVMCIAYGNELDIKEYPKKYISFVNTPSDKNQYLPIMSQDEQQGWWKLILQVPGVYDKPCLQIKTLDAKLYLTWSGEKDEVMKIVMELPHNVETRTVNGVISEDNQLILEGLLSSGRERCFTF